MRPITRKAIQNSGTTDSNGGPDGLLTSTTCMRTDMEDSRFILCPKRIQSWYAQRTARSAAGKIRVHC